MRSFGSLVAIVLGAVVLHSCATGQARGQIKTISKQGERVTLRSHMARGRHTVFEFYADGDENCAALAPLLRRAVEQADGVVLRRINVVSLKSRVALQHHIKSVPQIRLYDEGGKLLGRNGDALKLVLAKQRRAAPKPRRAASRPGN